VCLSLSRSRSFRQFEIIHDVSVCVCERDECDRGHVSSEPGKPKNDDRSLLQNIVSFIGLFCKRDL